MWLKVSILICFVRRDRRIEIGLTKKKKIKITEKPHDANDHIM